MLIRLLTLLLLWAAIPAFAAEEPLEPEQAFKFSARAVDGKTIEARWQGGVETAMEIPLLIKTTAANYPRVEEIVRAQHPYDVPELIATPITHGLPAYLDWVAKETDKHD